MRILGRYILKEHRAPFLFALGAYLGSLIKEMIFYTGLRFVIAGLATAIILILVGGSP